MNLHVQLIAETKNSSLSVLTIEGQFQCFILEDGYRPQKVKHETRIPPGRYKIERRRRGKFYLNYKRRFGHQFSIHLLDVPNFTFILIHIGNTISNTSGCLLTGFTASYNDQQQTFEVQRSTDAYKELYRKVWNVFAADEPVHITINREVPPFAPAPPGTILRPGIHAPG